MLAMIQDVAEEAAKAAAAPVWSLTDAEVVDCLRVVHGWEQTAAAVRGRLVAEAVARDIPAAHGHRSVPSWLRAVLLLDPRPARELADLADVVRRWPRLEQALIDGAMDARQAQVIASALADIPATLRDVAESPAEPGLRDAAESPAEPGLPSVGAVVDEAEAVLIGMAGQFPAYQLRRLGERILAHVAPEVADRADEAALRRQEARARRRRHVTLSLPVDGQVRLSGLLTVEDAAIVKAALEPLCTPIPGDDRTPGQRRADALIDVCRLALRTTELPDHGGEPPQMTVTVPFEPMTAALGAGRLDTGERVSTEAVRRMACDARILPVILGGAGQVLDAGRTRRLATGPLRRALVVRDRGCAFPGCDRPARWCDSHHMTPWTAGGSTSLNNMVLVCRHHHRLLHDPRSGWQVRLGADRLPEFIPPAWIDGAQRPQRNPYHPRT